MFRIYTKTGDSGESSLADGSRVPKSHMRLEVYGTIDELLASIGVLFSLLKESKDLEEQKKEALLLSLTRAQNELFSMSSEVAHPSYKTAKNRSFLIEASHISVLEKEIDSWDKRLEPLRNFILPGSHVLSAHAHVSRTVCRRAERLCVFLSVEEEIRDEITQYLNRLSDWLFVLGRFLDHLFAAEEKRWNVS